MSRTPGISNLLDVRTTAILQDYIITTNNCAPGIEAQLARRNKLSGMGLLENCQPPACGFDRPKDLLAILGASIIVATVIGTIHSVSVFLPSAAIEYNAGFIEFNVVVTGTYVLLLLTGCVAQPIIEYAGHKLTALFGMIMMFVGILIDSQVFHILCFYMGNLFLIGIGGGLAYAACLTLPADLFRAKLKTALMLLNISGCIGTIFHTWLFVYIVYTVGYKWAKLLQAILVLFFTLAVHVFPKTGIMYASGCDSPTGDTDNVRECVYKAATADVQTKKRKVNVDGCEDEPPPRNLLCVCVCDLRLYGDKSFLLWACLVMVATMNFYVPYLTLHSYAESAGARQSFWYITVYCIGSMAGRCAFIGNADFTFAYNRTVFQGCILLSGIMWIVLNWAVTFGWVMVLCTILGFIEGVVCVVTARVALATIPRRWINGAWLTCILCHTVGIFVTTTFTVVIVKRTLAYSVPYITGGIVQVIVSVLATLLPNEDEGASDAVAPTTPLAKPYSNRFDFSNCGQRGNYDFSSPSAARQYRGGWGGGSGSYYGGSAGSARMGQYNNNYISGNVRGGEGHYKCQCAICKKFGCLPGCMPDCTPAGSLDC